jgi:hypothetical protein
MTWIDYTQLPPSAGGYSDLFFDFLNNTPDARPFYRLNFRENSSFEHIIREQQESPRNRNVLTAVLREQNELYGATQRTRANITALENSTTFAVVTGQQVGIFGGPFYTVLKTLTTIRLPAQRSILFPVADLLARGGDRDFPRCATHRCLIPAGVTRLSIFRAGAPWAIRSIGDSVRQRRQATLTAVQMLFNRRNSRRSCWCVKKCYAPGASFNEAFARWLNVIFPDDGIVFLSSNHPALKRLLSPLFLREISEFPASSQIVIGQSAELEKTYHAQVKPKSVNLFLFHKGGRIRSARSTTSLRGASFPGAAELAALHPRRRASQAQRCPPTLAQDTAFAHRGIRCSPSELPIVRSCPHFTGISMYHSPFCIPGQRGDNRRAGAARAREIRTSASRVVRGSTVLTAHYGTDLEIKWMISSADDEGHSRIVERTAVWIEEA